MDRIVVSIHAFREEGDTYQLTPPGVFHVFQSTPSGRKATRATRIPPQLTS